MDPKTGDLAVPDEARKFGDTPVSTDTKPENPRAKAIKEMAVRAEMRRIDEQEGMSFDILDENTGQIIPNPAAKPEKVAAPELTESETTPEAPAEKSEPVVEAPAAPASIEPQPIDFSKPIDPNAQYVMTVDGRPQTFLGRQIIEAGSRTLNKDTAADIKLAAAARMEQQAREMLSRSQPSLPDAAPAKPESTADADDADLARKIQFGTEAEAKEAISLLRRQGRGASTEEIMAFVQQAMPQQINKQIEFHAAQNWANTQYPEVFSDPDMKNFFMMEESQRRAQGDMRSYTELYKDIGDKMLKKFNLRTEAIAPATPSGQGLNVRVVQKANAPRAPSVAHGKQPAPQPTRAPTVQEIVAAKRAARTFQAKGA